MNKFDTTGDAAGKQLPAARIILIEDSLALSRLIINEIEARVHASVHCFGSYKAAKAALERESFTLAIAGWNLPDAADGEMITLLAEHNVPTILFSGSLIEELTRNYAAHRLADYIVKAGKPSVERLVHSVRRIIENGLVSVLVVDDMKITRSDMIEFLERQNFKVISADTGTDALREMEEDPSIEIVLTDYYMPDMDGYELTQAIRARHGSDRIRIIGVSSSSDRHLSASFLKAGASDFIYRPFTPEELQCRIDNNVETLSQLKRLRYMAERDPLTTLFNRRAFFERAIGYLDQVSEGSAMGAVAIFDIDHFKRINDNFGHDVGDTVLRKVASIFLDAAITQNILPARLGGEEFAVLFPDCSRDQALELARQLLDQLRACRFEPQEKSFTISASVGLVGLDHREPLDNQLNAADQMLYLAKNSGRDRICSDRDFDSGMTLWSQ